MRGANATLLAVLAGLLLAFGLLIGEKFFSGSNLRSMAFQLPELGLLSLAMMISILSGGINLSIIASANLCALAMAFVLTRFTPGTEGVVWVLWQAAALVAGIALAGLIGLINGVLVAHLRVSPILATLGTMTICKGIAIGLTRGNVISGFPEPIVFLGNGTVFGVPMALLIFLACALPLSVLLARTPFGVSTAMMGSNEAATRFSGVETRRVTVIVYVLSGLLAAMAAVVMMARFNSANASYGESYLLVTILACVLGGIDPAGGFGKVSGLIIALVILQLISSAFNQLDISPFLTLAIWGAILIAVTAVPAVRARAAGLMLLLR